MANEPQVKAAPYLPLKTFLSALDALREGVPKRVDRAIWRSQSGAVQAQIMVAFRFFGLLDDADVPTLPLLEKLTKADEAERKKLLKPLVETKYQPIIAHDLTKMTPGMLNEEMEQFGVSGDTLRKAVTFFLQIAKYLDLPLSPYLKDKTRTSPRARRVLRAQNAGTAPNGTPAAPPPAVAGSTTSVSLRGGGTVTMNVTADVWTMPPEDRAFVLALVDKIQEYGKVSAAAKPKEKAAGQP
jgi:hypothetical protein